MFRKPPTKLEKLQDAAVDALDSLRDAVADLPAGQVAKTVAQRTETARRAAAAAQKTAAHAAAGAGQTAAHNLEAARERTAGLASGAAAGASHAAHTTGEALSGAAQHASEAVAHAAQALSDVLSGAASTAGGALGGAVHGASDRWHSLLGRAGDAAEHVGESAADAHDSLQDTASRFFRLGGQRAADATAHAQEAAHDWSGVARDAASAAASIAAARAAKAADAARSISRRSVTLPAPIEIEEKESSSSHWLWFLLGLLAGGAIMLLLAPASGRRNRQVAADKLRDAKKGAQHLGESAVYRAGDLKRRAEGALHERLATGEDDADDITIADRVRTALGEAPATRHLERLNVDVFEGLATLRGPVADAALQAEIESVVRAVKGVTDVKLDLLLEESADDAPTFVG